METYSLLRLSITEDFWKMIYPKNIQKFLGYRRVYVDEKVILKHCKGYKFKQDAKAKAFKFQHTRTDTVTTEVAMLVGIEDGVIKYNREFK